MSKYANLPTGVEASGTSGASDKSESISDVNASSTDDLDQSENPGRELVTSSKIPGSILNGLLIILGEDGHAYLVIVDKKNVYVLRIGSKQANNFLRRLAHQSGVHLKTSELRDINDELTAHAELSGDTRNVWYRVAPFKDGIEIDAGDGSHSRFRVTSGKVETNIKSSETLFHRTPGMRPLPMPDEQGDLKLLEKYINLDPASTVLLIAWIGYTLAHVKVSTTNFVILILQGGQGSGKSLLCRFIKALIDPSVTGVQAFPRNQKDLVIAAQHAHVLPYDNMRSIKPLMSDTLCTTSSGGTLTERAFYTNAEQHMHELHVALVLNGIHSFIDQPDLAQRCGSLVV